MPVKRDLYLNQGGGEKFVTSYCYRVGTSTDKTSAITSTSTFDCEKRGQVKVQVLSSTSFYINEMASTW